MRAPIFYPSQKNTRSQPSVGNTSSLYKRWLDKCAIRPAFVGRPKFTILWDVLVALCLTLSAGAAYSRQEDAQWLLATSSGQQSLATQHYENILGTLKGGLEIKEASAEIGPLLLADVSEPGRRAEAPASGPVAVMYPDIGEPYYSIFAKIIEGIESNMRGQIKVYPIGANTDVTELVAQLKRTGVKVVIALGRQGLKAASSVSATDRDVSVVAGGLLLSPETENRYVAGISLTPEPGLLFARLKTFFPSIKRVAVVFNPQHNEWLIKLARDAARAQGIELVPYEARDLATAARQYETILSSIDGRRDAVWLPQDVTTVDEGSILPLVLKESWNRNIPVFSSSFLHVKKGVLFALYPNNLELGHTLANSAFLVLSGDNRKRGIVPLHDVFTAVNLRTASHLGLNISYQQQRSFDFIFPEP